MKSRFGQIALVTLFVGLIATPIIVGRLADEAAPDEPILDPTTAIQRYGFHLRQVADGTGVRFVHQAPELDSRLASIMPQVAAYGASVSVADFNRDGWPDLYVTNSAAGSRNALYRNRGDGTFEDVAVELGVADVNRPGTGVSMGSVWGDYDNDGFEDLFLYKWGRPELFHNDKGRAFVPVGAAAELPVWVNANTAVWLDVDRDGFLDLFVGGYFPDALDLWHLPHTRIMPESFEYAHNGGRDWLFLNAGDGTFNEVSQRYGLTSRRWTLAATAADLNGSGYPDLLVANDYGVDELYINRHGKRFDQVGEKAGIGLTPKSGMNASVGDILNRSSLALYISNISEPGILLQGNSLWVPGENEDDGIPRYENLAGSLGVDQGGWSYGAQFGDLNNDGALDLFLVNGFFSGVPGRSYWYDFSTFTLGHRRIISDAASWPAMNGRSLGGRQRSRVWLNDGSGRFQDVAPMIGVTDVHDGRAVALVDLWNRGVLDVVVANQRGPLLIYRNTIDPSGDWIAFELEGSRSNRSAIGAQVRVVWQDGVQLQEVSGGSGFSSQNQRRLHFGLGPRAKVEKAVVRWPSGRVQTLVRPQIRMSHRIREAP